jgi:thiol-disulfide isomerase/thioredoxin
MLAPRLCLALACLAFPCAGRAAATDAGDAAARKALDGVVQHYRALKSYRFEGQAWSEVGSSQGTNQSTTAVRFLVRRPAHLSSEVRTNQMTTRIVADGESLWTAVPELFQYRVQTVAAARAGPDSALISRQFDPAGDYVRMLEGVREVRALGKDTVRTAHGVVTCDRYALTVANPEAAAPGVTMLPRVLWVDPATRMVLLDSVRIEQNHPQLGPVYSVNVTRMVVAEPDPALPADAFRFHPEEGMRRVRHFMQSSPEHAAMEGQPAGDFTLETLADSKPVKLSALKGKVVLLDFWATWCGPCRGWLPIVAKARRQFESKGLVVYAVNEREPEDKVREYLEKQKLDIPVLLDLSGTVGSIYRASSIPLTVVVGRDGNVFRVMVGLHGEDDLLDVLHEAGID